MEELGLAASLAKGADRDNTLLEYFKNSPKLDMTNNELMEKAKISKSTFYKMKNGQNITTDVLLRICNTLDCDIEEILECTKQ